MIRHPILLSVGILDSVTLIFSIYAAWIYLRVLTDYDADSYCEKQLKLEAQLESASIASISSFFSALFSSLMLMVALSSFLPPLVQGAMCGTGVMQGMGAYGAQMLALRFSYLLVAYFIYSIIRIDQRVPRYLLIKDVARWHLLSLPLLLMGTWFLIESFAALDPQQPVDCCQVIYDVVASKRTSSFAFDKSFFVLGFSISAILNLSAIFFCFPQIKRFYRFRILFFILALIAFCYFSLMATIKVFATYHYGVLAHECPFCLFLPEHNYIGYPLLFIFSFYLLDSLRFVAEMIYGKKLEQSMQKNSKLSVIRLMLLLIVFVLLLTYKALYWRFTYGVWIDG